MTLAKPAILAMTLLFSALALAPTAEADTCALSDDLDKLEGAVCGTILYGFCVLDGAPKQTLSRVVKDCDVTLLN